MNIIPIKSTEKLIEDQIIKETPLEFAVKVEDRVWMKDISYIDAILQIIEEEKYEVDIVPKLLTKELLYKIQEEAADRKLLKKSNGITLTSLSKFIKVKTS